MRRSRSIPALLPALVFLLSLLPAAIPAARAVSIYVPGSVEGGAGAYDYTDVSESDAYYDAVDWALVNGIANGTSETTFSPESGCTRAQVMTFLWRAAGEPAPKNTVSPFTDVKPGSWYYDAVLWAVEQGITNGTGAGTFSPDMPCTEEQILTFLWRAKGQPSAAAQSSSRQNAGQASWSSAATAWAAASGLVSGSSSSLSTTICTRGSTVSYLYESTVNYTDGLGTFESYTQVTLDGGVYRATSTSSFVSATLTLVNDYSNRVETTGADARYASGRLVVSAGAPLPDLSAYRAAQVVQSADGCSIVQFNSAADTAACADYLDSLSYVRYAEPDLLLHATAYTAGSAGWGPDATGAAAYAAGLARRGADTDIVVAVVDTGVDTAHPFLSGRTVSGYDFVDGDSVADDKDGHGTHVSGIVVDCTPGTQVKVMPVCVLGSDGSGYTSVIAQGIRYAADHGAKVINLSLGGGHSSYLDSAVSYALNKGVTVVAAAGNEGMDASYSCPAHIGGAITVAAVDSSYQRASFSNYGSALDIAAPGVGVRSSVPGGGYESWDGTSMATPHVSAAAALVLCGQGRNLMPATVEKQLKAAARSIGSSTYYGAGFLNLTPFLNGTVPDESDEPAPTPAPDPTPTPTPSPTPTPKTYTITFDPQGGTVSPATMQVTAGDSFGTLPTPVRSGYSFGGWYSWNGLYVHDYDIPGGDLTLYAGWTANAAPTPDPTPTPTPYPTPTPTPAPTLKTYTITFDPQGGTVSPATMQVTAGDSFGTLPTPVRSGYSFGGWYAWNGQYVHDYDIPGGDLTLYAGWTANAAPAPDPTPTPTPTPTPEPSPTPTPAPGGSDCGPSLTWSYSGGVLTISGMGSMYDYADGSQTPWAAYRSQIRAIQLPSMLNSIGSHAFEGCAVTSLSISGMVNRIGACTFRNCTSLSSLLISGMVNSIEANAFAGCTSLANISVSGMVNSVDPTAFPGGTWR